MKDGTTGSCPIIEQTGDGKPCGRCWFALPDGKTCPRHGDVSVYVERFSRGEGLTLENVMRQDRGQKALGKQHSERKGQWG